MAKSVFLDDVARELRKRGYARSTVRSYVNWIKRFILFHNKRHPAELGVFEIESFLSFLANDQNVAAATQNQALNALVFLYREVIKSEIGRFDGFTRARVAESLPVVFSRNEIAAIFSELSGTWVLIARLMYGGGLRVGETLSLRTKDIDFEKEEIHLHQTKHSRERLTLLAPSAIEDLRLHLKERWQEHQRDLLAGLGHAPLPHSLHKKYPKASRSWAWQYIFSSSRIVKNDQSRIPCRHHVSPSSFQKAFKVAMQKAEINKHASCHNLRHSFATHLLLDGIDIKTLQTLLGHKHIKTTSVYLQVANEERRIVAPTEKLPIVCKTAHQPEEVEDRQRTHGLKKIWSNLSRYVLPDK